jgi:hypothetical protein
MFELEFKLTYTSDTQNPRQIPGTRGGHIAAGVMSGATLNKIPLRGTIVSVIHIMFPIKKLQYAIKKYPCQVGKYIFLFFLELSPLEG